MNGEMAALAADFPAWHVWRGRNGAGRETDWHATLKGRAARRSAAAAGAPARLTAPDCPALRQLLGQRDKSMEPAA